MKHAVVRADGHIEAFYDPAVHEVPAGAIPIPDEEWAAHIRGQTRVWDEAAQQWVPYDPPPPSQQEVEAQIIRLAEQRMDAIADGVYTRSVSRGARYEQKYAEALRYRDAGYPGTVSAAEYPFLSAEAPARGVTKRELADAIIAAAEAYRQFAALVEAKRAELKQAVAAAADEPAMRAAAEAIVAEVQQAAAQLAQ